MIRLQARLLLIALPAIFPISTRADQETLAAQRASHQIQAILDSISAENIHSYLDTLVGFTYRHTNDDTLSDVTGIGAARRWVFRKFQEFSVSSGGRLQPQYFDFNATICASARLHRNVMAVLPGLSRLTDISL